MVRPEVSVAALDGHILLWIAIPLFVAIFVAAAIASSKRRKNLAAWCQARGLRFDESRVEHLDQVFPHCQCFALGDRRHGYNQIRGRLNGREVWGFDYEYTTGSGKSQTTHTMSAVSVQSGFPLKPLLIRPEGFFDKVAEFFGAEDIKFESAEFSRKFCVKSPDRKWAYDVLHERTMEFLLSSGERYTIQFDGMNVVVWKEAQFAVADYDAAVGVACGILDRMPAYLVQQQQTETV